MKWATDYSVEFYANIMKYLAGEIFLNLKRLNPPMNKN